MKKKAKSINEFELRVWRDLQSDRRREEGDPLPEANYWFKFN